MKTLYVHLPVGSNSRYNYNYIQSSQPIYSDKFIYNLQYLINNYDLKEIDEIKIIGGEPLIYKELNNVLQLLSCIRKPISILTNGIGLSERLDEFERLVHKIELSRFCIDDSLNKMFYKTNQVPTIFEIEEFSEYAKLKNIHMQMVLPICEFFNDDLITLIDFSKYLYMDSLCLRKIIQNLKNEDFSFATPYDDYKEEFIIKNKMSKIIVKNVKKLTVILENICKNTINNRYKKDEIIIIHPNGNVTNFWI